MIPNKVALTFCQSCEEQIGIGGLCLFGCRWDANTTRERPVIVVTFWRREMKPIETGPKGGVMPGKVF